MSDETIESLRADVARLTAERDEALAAIRPVSPAPVNRWARLADRFRREHGHARDSYPSDFHCDHGDIRDDERQYVGSLSQKNLMQWFCYAWDVAPEVAETLETAATHLASRDATIAELRALLVEAVYIGIECDEEGWPQPSTRRFRFVPSYQA